MFFMITYGLLNTTSSYEAVTKNPSYPVPDKCLATARMPLVSGIVISAVGNVFLAVSLRNTPFESNRGIVRMQGQENACENRLF